MSALILIGLACKCCGKEARWCDSVPDDEGDMHECDHIHCPHCNMHYSLEGPWPETIETFEQAKERMLAFYRGDKP